MPYMTRYSRTAILTNKIWNLVMDLAYSSQAYTLHFYFHTIMGPSYVLHLVWGPTLVHKMVPI